ncbi:MAG: DUF4959 domain-containing protein [Prevotellaceae bacterium]|jgi:hypothetical protein|nr:DUF4959 domain-containing protein [Prevotellaceae bacterium]
MNIKKFLLISIIFLVCSCSEEKRFDINSEDSVPPAAPVISRYEPSNGSVRIFYTPPSDNDVISVDAQYTRKSDGEVFHFSTSYFSNSIEVYGLADTVIYDLELYAVDRAGNQSPKITYQVKPLESAILKVKQSMVVKGGFDALFARWTNELTEPVNVFIDYSFTMDGTARSLTRVFTSQAMSNRYYITDLTLPPDSPIKTQFRISDNYGNYTDPVDVGNLYVLKDVEISKMDADRNPLWSLPEVNTVPLAEYGNTVSQVFGNVMDGNILRVIDGTIDQNENLNYLMAESPHPWSLMIDLNDYYELSRIVTHQRHTKSGGAEESVKRGNYFTGDNIGRYRMYRWDDETSAWDTISVHTIPMPQGTLSQLDWNKLGRAGDMAYMYPDEPAYTKPTRWFRYEALGSFGMLYYPANGGSLSEITLYCKQK